MRQGFLLLIILSATGFSSCLKTPASSNIPNIEFSSYTIGDTIDATPQHIKYVNLKVKFTDGDGDIGLDKTETDSPYDLNGGYYYNLIATYYELENGVFVKKSDEKSRIPRLTKYSNKHGLQGFIEVRFDLYVPAKTIRYDIFIYDRALHKSNVVSTPDIVIS